jgi:hypothetical protein
MFHHLSRDPVLPFLAGQVVIDKIERYSPFLEKFLGLAASRAGA